MERPQNRLDSPLFLVLLVLLPCWSPTLRCDDAEDREATLLFNTASRFYRQKNWDDAANAFSEFLKKFPAHRDAAEARFAAGYCLNRRGKHAEAVELLRLAVRDESAAWSADSHFYLGRSLEALAQDAKNDAEERVRRLVAASESYGRAAELYAKDSGSSVPGEKAKSLPGGEADGERSKDKLRDFRVLAMSAQGEALYQASKLAEASEALKRFLDEGEALQDSPHYQRGVYVLGLARQALAKNQHTSLAEAMVALRAASQPRFEKEALWEEAAYLLARLTHQENDLEKAIECYGPVVKKGGGRAPEAAYYRALALYETQKPESLARAREELGRLLREHPKHALAGKARFYEALSAFDLKDFVGSEAAFQAVVSESPDLAGRALLRRGQALLLRADPNAALAAAELSRAVEALEQEAARSPKDAILLERAAEALYWQGEALLSQSGKLAEAAQAFGQVHSRFAKEAPELAEKGLYQRARALYLAGKHAESAEACDLYRRSYKQEQGLFFAETLLLSAECGFHGPAGSVPDALRREAPRFYREASAALKNAAEARRAKYMSGVSLYFLADYKQAAQTLEEVLAEASKDPAARAALPELSFYLADSLAQEPRREKATAEDRARWQRAVQLYTEYLNASKDGTHIPNALVNLGLAQEWLEDHTGAQKTFERFLTQFSSHALASQVRFELGNTRLVSGDLEAAALAYSSAAESEGAQGAILPGKALYQKALLERRMGKSSLAAETLTGLITRHEDALKAEDQGQKLLRDATYQRSIALLESGKGDDGRRELMLFLSSHAGSPQEAEARNQLARSLLDAAEPTEALEVLEPLLQAGVAQAGRDQALYLAAWCHSSLSEVKGATDAAKQKEEMEAAYRKLIGEHPQSPLAVDSMLELGQNLFNRKAYAESRKWLEQVREILDQAATPPPAGAASRPRDLLERSLFGLGFIAFEEGDFRRASKLFDLVIENPAAPLAPRAGFQAGRAYMKQEAFAESAARFDRVVNEFEARAEDLHEEGLLRLGESYHQLQRYPEAIQTLDRALKEHPEGELRHEVRFAKGFALQFSGDFDGAVEAYRGVVNATRQSVAARAQYHIGECRVEQGRHRDAAKEFSATVANFDLDGPYREWVRRSLLAAGIAFQAAGDAAASSLQFRELLERFPESDEGKAAADRLKALSSK